MEHNSLLRRAVEVQPILCRNVHQVVGRQPPVCRALKVVRCEVVALLAGGRTIPPTLGVIAPVRQQLQGQKGVGCAALAQVDLDRRVLPAPPAPAGDEVNPEPSQHTALPQHFRHPASCLRDLPVVRRVSGECAAEEDLARRPAQHLIVRRDDLHCAERVYASLH